MRLRFTGRLGTKFNLRLYQLGNTSSHKNTEIKQRGPQLALGWVTIHGLDDDVDGVATCTVKSQKEPQKYAPGEEKKNFKTNVNTLLNFEFILMKCKLIIL